LVDAAAARVAHIGSAVSAAGAAAASPTTALAAAAGDEVSAAIADVFSRHAQVFQGASAQAASFQQRFVHLLGVGAASYAGAEAASVDPLLALQRGYVALEGGFLSVLNAPTQALFGRALIGNGAAGYTDAQGMGTPGQPGGLLIGNGGRGGNSTAPGAAGGRGGDAGLIGMGGFGGIGAPAFGATTIGGTGGNGGMGGLLLGAGGTGGMGGIGLGRGYRGSPAPGVGGNGGNGGLFGFGGNGGHSGGLAYDTKGNSIGNSGGNGGNVMIGRGGYGGASFGDGGTAVIGIPGSPAQMYPSYAWNSGGYPFGA